MGIELKEKFDGHIILYCKGHYSNKDFFEGLRRIWAVRCGLDPRYTSKQIDPYIATHMFEIIKLVSPKRVDFMLETLHKHVANPAPWVGDLSPIELIIYHYGEVLSHLQIRDGKEGGKWKTLIHLPKPQKRLFNRIINGKYRRGDYELVK